MISASDNLVLDLGLYVRRVFSHWKRSLLVSLILAFLLYGLSAFSPPVFTSAAVIMPSDALNQDLGAQFELGGGDAVSSALRSSLLGAGQGDRNTEYRTTLLSEDFIRRAVYENNWVPLMFPDGWDAQQKRWVKDPNGSGISLSGIMAGVLSLIRTPVAPTSMVASNPSQNLLTEKARAVELAGGPSVYDMIKRFDTMVDIRLDSQTGYITISATMRNATAAYTVVQGLIDQLNKDTRERTRLNAEREVAYVKQKIGEEQNETVRAAYLGVLQRQLRVQMLSAVVKDYAVREIAVPVIPTMKSAPIRTLYFIFGFMLGAFLCVMYDLTMQIFGLHCVRTRFSLHNPFGLAWVSE